MQTADGGDVMCAHMQAKLVIVATAQQVTSIHKLGQRTGKIGLDCEGCALSRSGKLCLVQVG